MSTRETFRRSSEALLRRFNDSPVAGSVTLTRGSVALFEAISGAPAVLYAGSAAEDATTLPLNSMKSLSGRIRPGTTIALSGHASTYTAQQTAETSSVTISVEIDPGLEAATNGEAATLTPKSMTFTGAKMNIAQADLPSEWQTGAAGEVWGLVPGSTADGNEPREGDLMTAPMRATVASVGHGESIEGVQYLVLLTPTASEEAA